MFIVRDISAAKQIERDSEKLRRQQALVEMSALLAHEIRNPLGSLELFAGLLAEANLEGESRRWIEHVQAGLRTLSSTVNNVLDLHNEPPAERAQMDVGELLGWAYDFLMPLAHQSGVEIQIINGLADVSIQADRHLIEQVLLNLALNAFRAMPGGGWLSIRGIEDGTDGVRIEVRDCGPGIPEEHLPRIFEAGFSTRPGSSGLGLAVCRRIVEEHGGTIAVESRLGHGTTFRLRLPTISPRAPIRIGRLKSRPTSMVRTNETTADCRRRCRNAGCAGGALSPTGLAGRLGNRWSGRNGKVPPGNSFSGDYGCAHAGLRRLRTHAEGASLVSPHSCNTSNRVCLRARRSQSDAGWSVRLSR